MAFIEDPRPFLNEFAVEFIAKGVKFKGLLDEDDELIGESSVNSKSAKYVVTYFTADVTLNRGDVVKQGDQTFKVREPSMQLDDGAFSEVYLTKTAS